MPPVRSRRPALPRLGLLAPAWALLALACDSAPPRPSPLGVVAATVDVADESSCVALFDSGTPVAGYTTSVSWSGNTCWIRARAITVAAGDTLRVPAGVTLRLDTSSVSNAGRVEVVGTFLNYATSFLNAGELANTGTITADRLANGVTVTLGGTIILQGPGSIVNDGTMWLDGEARHSPPFTGGGVSSFTNNGTVNVRNELTLQQTLVNHGTIVVSSSSDSIRIEGKVNGDWTGSLENHGTVRNNGHVVVVGGRLVNHGRLESAWEIHVTDTTLVANPGAGVPNSVGVFENHGTFLNGLTPFSSSSQPSGAGRNAAVLRMNDVSRFSNATGAVTTNQGFVYNDAIGSAAMRNESGALFENYGSLWNDGAFTNAGRFVQACHGSITGTVAITGNPVELLACVPTPVPGGPYSAGEGVAFQLDGTGSLPAPTGAAIASYAWDLLVDGGPFDADLTGPTPSVQYPDDVPAHPIALRVTDVTGASAVATTTLKVFNLPPVAYAGPDASYEQRDRTGARVTLDGSGSTDPGADALTYRWRIGSQTLAPPSASPIETVTLALGVHVVTLVVSDGDFGTDTDDVVVTVRDSTPPAVAVPADLRAEGNTVGGANLTLPSATATDLVDPAPVVGCDRGSGFFPVGQTTVTCTATDASGNSASGTFRVTVVDTTPPSLLALPDRVAEATGPAGAAVAFGLPAASDVVDGPVPAACSPAPGSTFALGTTVVTCSATDAHGNVGTIAFSVTVVDTTPPALASMPDLVAEATGPAGATVGWPAPVALDLVDGEVPATCVPASGTGFPLGGTEVTCRAVDAAGNAAEATFRVDVVDTTPPAITTPDHVYEVGEGVEGSTIVYEATAYDLVSGSVAVNCTPFSGSVFPPATTTVSCEAWDLAGNRATASFDVSLLFSWSGLLPPIGCQESFELGRTLPVKFELVGASECIEDLAARLFLAKLENGTLGPLREATSRSAANEGNLFRHHPHARQYVYELDTRGLDEGTWALLVDLGDGVLHQTLVSLRP